MRTWISEYVVAVLVFAVLEGFPATIVPIDLAWGAVVAASTSVATYAVVRRLPVTGREHRPPAPPAR